jgi:hypothetical protein
MNTLAKWAAGVTGVAGAAYGTYVAATWLRFGRPKRYEDALLDRFMPAYEVSDHHASEVAGPPDAALAAAKQLRLDRSRIVRAVFRGRELILRGTPDRTERPGEMLPLMISLGWAVLAETPSEIVLGAVTKPWEVNPTFRTVPADQFAAFAEPGYVKIAWMLRAEPAGDGRSRLSTQTRAVATDPVSRARFRWYWAFLSPGIKLIRRAALPVVAAELERRGHGLPGDDIVADARAELTHAITIDAPPRDVWPWLVQMGCQRAGWYSWDALDNGGERSADRIIPLLQDLEVGDVLPMRPTGDDGFTVLRIDPERALVLGNTAPHWEGTWAFVLEPVGADRTRLVTRYRAKYPRSIRMALFRPWMAAVHAVMERKQLRTIKHHAEHAAAAQA